jgi:hypothetical protein
LIARASANTVLKWKKRCIKEWQKHNPNNL